MNKPQSQEKAITKDGLTIYKIWFPPDAPTQMEGFHLYRVDGWPHLFLNARHAWDKAEELANEASE